MKKLYLSLILALVVALCAGQAAMAAGWEVNVSAPAGDKAAVAKALTGQQSVDLHLAAYLGRQANEEGGTDYCVLVKADPANKDKVPYYALAYVSVNKKGSAMLRGWSKLTGVGLNSRWTLTRSSRMTYAQSQSLKKRLTSQDGASFKWVGYLGYRGSRQNAQHCILYRVTTPGSQPSLQLVYVNTRSGASVKVSNAVELDIAAYAK